MLYPHCSVKRSRYLIVLFQPRTTAQNLRKPELANGTLEMSNLALDGRRCLYPLRWFSANTTYHIGMGQCFGCAVAGPLLHHGAGQGLCDARMQRRRAVWNDQVFVVTTDRSARLARVRA